MGSQEFCLKWNNHQGNLIEVFGDLLKHEAFVDVTLACQGLSMKVHKVVLSACSSFFRDLFQANPCKHPIVFMSDVSYTNLQAIIEFMYKGEVNVSQVSFFFPFIYSLSEQTNQVVLHTIRTMLFWQEKLPGLLKTAEALQIKGLAEVQADRMSSDGDSMQSHPHKRKRNNSGPSQQKSTASRQLNIPDKVLSLHFFKFVL